jgi:hypothetical protein
MVCATVAYLTCCYYRIDRDRVEFLGTDELTRVHLSTYVWLDRDRFCYCASADHSGSSPVYVYDTRLHASNKTISLPATSATVWLISVSPNGKFLVWSKDSLGSSISVRTMWVSNLRDRSRTLTFVSPDASTWVSETDLCQFSCGNGRNSELARVSLDGVMTRYGHTALSTSQQVVAATALTSSDIEVLLDTPRESQYEIAHVRDGNLTSERRALVLPQSAKLISAEISDTGRIALLLRIDDQQPESWLYQYQLQKVWKSRHPMYSIAVSDATNGNIENLASLHDRTWQSDYNVTVSVGMHWVPSADLVSFVDEKTLWAVPAK